jgi:hypothetical protein
MNWLKYMILFATLPVLGGQNQAVTFSVPGDLIVAPVGAWSFWAANDPAFSNAVNSVSSAASGVNNAQLVAGTNAAIGATIATNNLLLSDIATTNLANLQTTTNYVVGVTNLFGSAAYTTATAYDAAGAALASTNRGNLMFTNSSAYGLTGLPWSTGISGIPQWLLNLAGTGAYTNSSQFGTLAFLNSVTSNNLSGHINASQIDGVFVGAFSGDASQMTNYNGANLTGGTITNASTVTNILAAPVLTGSEPLSAVNSGVLTNNYSLAASFASTLTVTNAGTFAGTTVSSNLVNSGTNGAMTAGAYLFQSGAASGSAWNWVTNLGAATLTNIAVTMTRQSIVMLTWSNSSSTVSALTTMFTFTLKSNPPWLLTNALMPVMTPVGTNNTSGNGALLCHFCVAQNPTGPSNSFVISTVNAASVASQTYTAEIKIDYPQ